MSSCFVCFGCSNDCHSRIGLHSHSGRCQNFTSWQRGASASSLRDYALPTILLLYWPRVLISDHSVLCSVHSTDTPRTTHRTSNLYGSQYRHAADNPSYIQLVRFTVQTHRGQPIVHPTCTVHSTDTPRTTHRTSNLFGSQYRHAADNPSCIQLVRFTVQTRRGQPIVHPTCTVHSTDTPRTTHRTSNLYGSQYRHAADNPSCIQLVRFTVQTRRGQPIVHPTCSVHSTDTPRTTHRASNLYGSQYRHAADNPSYIQLVRFTVQTRRGQPIVHPTCTVHSTDTPRTTHRASNLFGSQYRHPAGNPPYIQLVRFTVQTPRGQPTVHPTCSVHSTDTPRATHRTSNLFGSQYRHPAEYPPYIQLVRFTVQTPRGQPIVHPTCSVRSTDTPRTTHRTRLFPRTHRENRLLSTCLKIITWRRLI